GPSPVSQTTNDAGRALVGPVLYTLDATSAEAWRNFSFRLGAVVDGHGDLAFKRYAIVAGPGAGILDLGETAFEQVRTVPADGYRGDEVIGEIAGRNQVVVADKVAINAVMAGCKPEYLPVVVAALKGLCHADFAYHGPASSTGGSAMVLIVNGPIVRALGINSGNNAF